MVHTPASDRDVPRPRAVPPAGQINPQRGECHYLSTGQNHNDYHTQARPILYCIKMTFKETVAHLRTF